MLGCLFQLVYTSGGSSRPLATPEMRQRRESSESVQLSTRTGDHGPYRGTFFSKESRSSAITADAQVMDRGRTTGALSRLYLGCPAGALFSALLVSRYIQERDHQAGMPCSA